MSLDDDMIYHTLKGIEGVPVVRYKFLCGNDRSFEFSAPEAQSDKDFARIMDEAANSLRASHAFMHPDDVDNEILECDVCKKDNHVSEIFHFSGILNKKLSKHLHVCDYCVDDLGLINDLDIDSYIMRKKERDG